MELILFIVIASLLFPGLNGGGYFEPMMIPVFIVCAALVLGFVVALTYIAIFVAEQSNGWLGVVTWFGLFIGTLLINKLLAQNSRYLNARSLRQG